jgi:Cu-Zn family superoxide dismutase
MRKRSAPVSGLLLAGALLGAATASHAQALRAFAPIKGCGDAYSAVGGRLEMVERPSPEGVKLVDVRLQVQGLPDGKHAVHIHEVGACTPCADAKGHFDPGPASNSSPDGNHPFHSGDLVNIEIRNGQGAMQTTTSRVTLSDGPLSVFDADGSALIVHVDPDTYCLEGEEKGCAGGARAACGVIERY